MILDERLEFGSAMDLTNSVGTYLAGDVIDFGAAGRDIGQTGRPLYLVIQVTTSIIAAAAGNIHFRLVSDAQAAITADLSPTEHIITQEFSTNVLASTALLEGEYVVRAPLPLEGERAYERYMGLLYQIKTEDVTGGAVNAFLTWDVAANKYYADASN